MIYIIYDESYELDDYTYNGDRIVYLGTNKEDAIAHFEKYYGDTPNIDSEKYCYEYSLCEYPDGWNIYESNRNKSAYCIYHVINIKEEE